jgi:hypothetical protein
VIRPIPPHRVKHGTEQGYQWHSYQRRYKDPGHETCPRCKKFWRDRQQAYRRRRRAQRKIIMQILVGGQEKARAARQLQDIKDIERLVNKYGTPEQKEQLFS